jgi:hypothetical protein
MVSPHLAPLGVELLEIGAIVGDEHSTLGRGIRQLVLVRSSRLTRFTNRHRVHAGPTQRLGNSVGHILVNVETKAHDPSLLD